MTSVWRRPSLSRRVFVGLILGETLFAVVLGVTIGAFSAFSSAHQREEAIREVGATIAASLMPTIAEQETPRVQAQLSSMLAAANARDVTGIRVVDSSGALIAAQGTVVGLSDAPPTPRANPFAFLTQEQTVAQPIEVDGLKLATVHVRFSAPGLAPLALPAGISSIVLLSVMLVSVPWTAWWLTRDLVEPLNELGEYAARIAEGDLDASLTSTAYGEIGGLQEALSSMGRQLKAREEQLRVAFEGVSDACLALEEARLQIERLSTVKSNFVAVAAHEIRSPLTTLSLYAELLLEGEAGTLDAEARGAVGEIAAAASRLASIVSDLMDSALLERGLLPIQFGDVELAALLRDAVKNARVLGRAKGTEVELVDSTQELTIRGDVLRLHQVLNNLLSNALKYSPDGSDVRVRASAVDGGWAVIEVADEGRGIPAENAGQLFALFGRLDFGDSRDAAGLGLGLAITARIVEAHGGSISYRANEAGRGSIFSVWLPIGGPADAPLGRVTIQVAESGGRRESI